MSVAPLTFGGMLVSGQSLQKPSGGVASVSPALAQAQELLQAGRFDEVIKTLAPLAEAKPNDVQIKYLLGSAYYQKSDHARAVEHLATVVRQMPENSLEYRQLVQMLALSHYVQGHLKDAVPYLEQVNRWAPDNSETTYALGISYIQTHATDKARAAFARMFRLAPNSAPAHLITAQMMVRQQFEEFAEKELQKALELDPKLPQANFLLGELAIFRAQIDLGIELLQKEIAVNPAFGMAYYRLGEAYTRQLKWDDAIAPLQKSIWLNPYFSGPYIVLGKVYLKKSDSSNAESMLRRALQMDPNNFSGHHLLAQVLQQSGRAEEARKEFETAERLRTSSEKKE
ncbi:MAG TPA: tetratricopeptide repeat protein [Pyrinomonadaceae bacterium]|nr:tetratricopeptide repeat protein [Pyrinomonadaceae bacterium]